jgi:hypothetical protein
MIAFSINTTAGSTDRTQQLREAVLLSFCDPLLEECARLWHLSGKEWQQLLFWLDTSGLALYFLDRMVELDMCKMLPQEVFARLQQNLLDNTARTNSLITESNAIHRAFQRAGFSYATLKGFSLYPSSVPRLELRSQLDLDFLIAEKNATDARRILEDRGYRLRAISGRSWEFKTNELYGTSLKDLYKAIPSYSVELHIEADNAGHTSLLDRTKRQCFQGVCMPVLAPLDLFLGQGLHLYKHVCSEFSRTAHMIEFRRHVIARRDDIAFWKELQLVAEANPKSSLALGVVTLLITGVMGNFAPEALTNWTVGRLPSSARLWVDKYGRSLVFASFPGSKLYLLLQKELESSGVSAKRSLRQSLLPLSLPPPVVRAVVNETLPARGHRYRIQLHFILFRLRFHTVEGLRYLLESLRWRRHMNQLAP